LPAPRSKDNLRIVPLFPALEFSSLSSKTSAPDEDIQLGTPRTLTAVSHVRLPEGFRTDLPDPIHAKTEFATFDKTYRYQNNEVVVERMCGATASLPVAPGSGRP
jgi:hypothetical protein